MEQIREMRKAMGVSQAKLAVTAGMDPATLNRIEQGKANPNVKTLERLADALGVEVRDFFPKGPAPSRTDIPTSRRRRGSLPDFKDFLLNEAGSMYLAVPHALFERSWDEADTDEARWQLYEQVRREHAAVVRLADEVRDDLWPVQREKLEKIWLRQANARYVDANRRVAQKTDA